MDCQKAQQDILAADDLDAVASAADLRGHLAGCLACREILSKLQRLESAARNLPMPATAGPPDEFLRRVREKASPALLSGSQPVRRYGRFSLWRGRAVAAAVTLAVGLTILSLVLFGGSEVRADVVFGQLVEWNLEIAHTPDKAARVRLCRERRDTFRKTVARGSFTAKERALAEALLENAERLTTQDQSVEEAHAFSGIADRLLAVRNMTTDPAAVRHMESVYQQVVKEGVVEELGQVNPKDLTPAERARYDTVRAEAAHHLAAPKPQGAASPSLMDGGRRGGTRVSARVPFAGMSLAMGSGNNRPAVVVPVGNGNTTSFPTATVGLAPAKTSDRSAVVQPTVTIAAALPVPTFVAPIDAPADVQRATPPSARVPADQVCVARDKPAVLWPPQAVRVTTNLYAEADTDLPADAGDDRTTDISSDQTVGSHTPQSARTPYRRNRVVTLLADTADDNADDTTDAAAPPVWQFGRTVGELPRTWTSRTVTYLAALQAADKETDGLAVIPESKDAARFTDRNSAHVTDETSWPAIADSVDTNLQTMLVVVAELSTVPLTADAPDVSVELPVREEPILRLWPKNRGAVAILFSSPVRTLAVPEPSGVGVGSLAAILAMCKRRRGSNRGCDD